MKDNEHEVHEPLPEAMSRWEKFIHAEAPDRLIQLALLHAEFEALHPFLDGNGRLGRMLIPLFLYQARIIQQPMFYISAYLESHRDEYYERLLADRIRFGLTRYFSRKTQVADITYNDAILKTGFPAPRNFALAFYAENPVKPGDSRKIKLKMNGKTL